MITIHVLYAHQLKAEHGLHVQPHNTNALLAMECCSLENFDCISGVPAQTPVPQLKRLCLSPMHYSIW